MAYTITEPNILQPVYNDLTFTVIDDDRTQPSFKYIFKTYVNGVLVNTTKLYPRPNGYAIFSPHHIIQQYISREYRPTLSGFSQASNNEIVKYLVAYSAEYDVAGTLTEVAKHGGNTKYTWNGVAQWHDAMSVVNNFVLDYTPISGSTSTRLTLNWPYTGTTVSNGNELYTTDKRNISAFRFNSSGSNTIDGIRITTDVIGSTDHKVYTYQFPAVSGSLGEPYIVHFPIGLTELNAITWTSATSGSGLSTTITPDEDLGFKVEFIQNISAPTASLAPVYFKLTETCDNCPIDHYTVAYQTSAGGYGYINMDGKHYHNLTSEKVTYDKIRPYNYSTTDRITTVYGNLANETIDLNTGWIYKQGIIDQIRDMILSPDIWVIDKNNISIPVYIDKQSSTIRDIDQDGMINYTFTFAEAFKKNTIK